jgi:hypothetical protein
LGFQCHERTQQISFAKTIHWGWLVCYWIVGERSINNTLMHVRTCKHKAWWNLNTTKQRTRKTFSSTINSLSNA